MYKSSEQKGHARHGFRSPNFIGHHLPSSRDWLAQQQMAWALMPHHPVLNIALHLLAMRSCVSFDSLCLSFLICKRGVILVRTS